MKPLFVIALGVILFGLGALALAEEKKKDEAAVKIVGKWEITKTDLDLPVGTIVEFTKDGKFSIAVNNEKIEGTYKIQKDKLITEAKVGDQTMEDTDTIKKLTADTLEIEGMDKKVTVFKKK